MRHTHSRSTTCKGDKHTVQDENCTRSEENGGQTHQSETAGMDGAAMERFHKNTRTRFFVASSANCDGIDCLFCPPTFITSLHTAYLIDLAYHCLAMVYIISLCLYHHIKSTQNIKRVCNRSRCRCAKCQ